MKGTVYDKTHMLRESVFREFSALDKKEFIRIIAKLASWHYPNKRGNAFPERGAAL